MVRHNNFRWWKRAWKVQSSRLMAAWSAESPRVYATRRYSLSQCLLKSPRQWVEQADRIVVRVHPCPSTGWPARQSNLSKRSSVTEDYLRLLISNLRNVFECIKLKRERWWKERQWREILPIARTKWMVAEIIVRNWLGLMTDGILAGVRECERNEERGKKIGIGIDIEAGRG